jgi:hypothetical protein
VFYLEFLRRVHEVLAPPTYFEIGSRHGDSLTLARSPSGGVDPAYAIRSELPQDTVLFRETSDEYFDREDPLEPFHGQRFALSFIDGMYHIEYALRDFINVERCSEWTSVVVFDDILPHEAEWASRSRITRMWTGDVYKILDILARNRPDLTCLRVATEPTGLLLVLALDPTSSVLDERFDDLLLASVAPDPQPVPEEVLERHGALEPDAVLSASFWAYLRDTRDDGAPRQQGARELRKQLRRDFGAGVTRPPFRRFLPARA